jgi:hypothetical protein
MPFVMKNIPHTYKWRVMNKETGKVFAKGTTRKKAERQIRLLYMMERNKNYSRKKR